MLDVVKIDEEKAEENIIFENLEYLEFTSLPSFRSFCYEKQAFVFPSFIRFIVKGCPRMEIFSSGVTVAPYLTKILVEEGKMRWKGDLNRTIDQLKSHILMLNETIISLVFARKDNQCVDRIVSLALSGSSFTWWDHVLSDVSGAYHCNRLGLLEFRFK
ncbi:Rpp4 candidate [Trifolium pratense]|uniref:Rpp4 candidate n=1 Tax=Trifolium pratense TaxID=57577 RepID=A0A2K3KC82_TRIPR|nr:Rpp4 candidate [Trifolium pratense]